MMKKIKQKKTKKVRKKYREMKRFKRFYGLVKKSKITRFFYRFVIHNFWQKMLALVIAFSLYIYFEMQNMLEKMISVPLEVSLPKGLTSQSAFPEKVNLYLRGNKMNMGLLDQNLLGARINFLQRKAGEYFMNPVPYGNLPEGVRIVRISPPEIPIVLSTISSKIVNVEAEFVNNPRAGYLMKDYKISPKQIVIKGPRDLLDSVISLKTEPISIRGLSTDKEVEVSLNRNINSLIRFDGDQRYRVKMHMSEGFKELVLEKNLQVKPVKLKKIFKLTTKKRNLMISNIHYRVSEQSYKKEAKPRKVEAFTDLSKIAGVGLYETKVSFKLPKDWEVISFEPKVITVQVISNTRFGLLDEKSSVNKAVKSDLGEID